MVVLFEQNLIVFSAILLVTVGQTFATVNVAFNRSAYQSSTFVKNSTQGENGLRIAAIAVDGYPLASQCTSQLSPFDGLFSHTQLQESNWWRVDLGAIHIIYRITVCVRSNFLRGRLNGTIVLSSVTDIPSEPRPGSTDWKHIYTILNPVEYMEEDFDAALSARHISLFQSSYKGVTLREVTVEGFSQADIDNITLKLVEEQTTECFTTLRVSLSGFNDTIFESTSLSLYRVFEAEERDLLGRVIGISGEEVLQIPHRGLMASTAYAYEVALTTYNFTLANQTFESMTSGSFCYESTTQIFDTITTHIQIVSEERTNGQSLPVIVQISLTSVCSLVGGALLIVAIVMIHRRFASGNSNKMNSNNRQLSSSQEDTDYEDVSKWPPEVNQKDVTKSFPNATCHTKNQAYESHGQDDLEIGDSAKYENYDRGTVIEDNQYEEI